MLFSLVRCSVRKVTLRLLLDYADEFPEEDGDFDDVYFEEEAEASVLFCCYAKYFMHYVDDHFHIGSALFYCLVFSASFHPSKSIISYVDVVLRLFFVLFPPIGGRGWSWRRWNLPSRDFMG